MALTSLLFVVALLGVLVSSQTPPAQTAIGATGSFSGYYLNIAEDPYMTTSPSALWAITPVSENLYTIKYGGIYLSSLIGIGSYNLDGADQSYNQFTLTQQANGTWFIVSPYLQAYNGHGYLCVQATAFGPYCPSFCTSAYAFILTASLPPTPTPSPTPTPTPAPTPSPTPVPVRVKALRDSTSGYFINSPPSPYLSLSPVRYTIEPVSGSTTNFTIRSGSWFISARIGASGFSQDGAGQAYNQFNFQPQTNGAFLIFSQYLHDYNGYGWLSSAPTLYGPYLSFDSVNLSWFLEY